MSVKLVRRLAELLLLLGACGGLSFFLQQQSASRPTWISGIVVDWNTGKRVGNAPVFSMEMNSSREMGRTDSKGLFSISVPSEPRPYFLYAGGPSFGRLLQSTFGRGLIVWSGGERHSGIVLAGIPATLLTGHVYDGASTPISGCEVAALTKSAASKKGQEGENPYRTEVVLTNKSGFFSFNYLGADRYFVVANCHKYLPGERAGYAGSAPSVRRIHRSWPVTVFPNARSFERAEELVLLPGDRRERLDFHLQAAARHSIHGHIVLSDGSRPRSFPGTFTERDISLLLANPQLAMLVPPSGVCGWGPTVDKFHCDDLSPGSYRLRFSQGPTPEQSSQEGILIVEVKNKNTEATIRLSLSPGVAATPQTADISKTGSLQLERICQASSAASRLRTTARGEVWFAYDDWSRSPCSAQKFNLAPGRYEIATYEDAFSERHMSRPSKILDLLEQRAVTVTIRDKATTRIVLPVWTAENMIDMALSSLRKEAQEQDSKAIGYRPQ